ncbi:putative chitinase [Helianthus debilis subsp. tardiflorus]
MKTTLLFTCIFLAVLIFIEPVASQKCKCAPHMCCSKYGYCGTTSAYCGKDCRGGPCSLPAPNNNANVAGIVSVSFFNGIVYKSKKYCPGRRFYIRDAFLKALKNYPHFGRSGSIADSKREIAAFFAHVTHETGRKLMNYLNFFKLVILIKIFILHTCAVFTILIHICFFFYDSHTS